MRDSDEEQIRIDLAATFRIRVCRSSAVGAWK